MLKIKNDGLNEYGAEAFEQLQFGTAGVERVKLYRYAFTFLKIQCNIREWVPVVEQRDLFALTARTTQAIVEHTCTLATDTLAISSHLRRKVT